MQYRTLGTRVTDKVSALGFGCMRFPRTADEDKRIDRDESARMLDLAVDAGVNYLDTAWPYHGGESEEFLGEYLANRDRKSLLLATKMPIWETKEESDLDRIFQKQLEKLQTDYVDFYLLHALDAGRVDTIKNLKMIEWGEARKREGKIRYFGFSFHDELPVFKQFVDLYDGWDFCQIQYNYMNESVQAGTEGLRYAAEKGIGVVVMEPLLGGALAEVPDAVRAVFSPTPGDARAETATSDAPAGNGRVAPRGSSPAAPRGSSPAAPRGSSPAAPRGSSPVVPKGRSPVEWALDWLWDKPEVGLVLSGMSTMQQVEEDVEFADRSAVGMLTPAERGLFPKAKAAYESLHPVPCTQCNYCMPCEYGVDIPGNFALLNEFYKFGRASEATWRYNKAMPEGKRATACVRCMECVPKCPQSIQIPDCLERVNEELVQAAG